MIAREHAAEAARDMQRAKELGPVKRFGKTGRQSMRIPLDAFFRAVSQNGGVDARGKTCWDDKEFVRDMTRHHPHIVCAEDGRTSISFAGSGLAVPRNRFGKVSYRKVYA